MQPTIEAALAQHSRNILRCSQQRPCFFKVTAEIQRGDDRSRQHFRIVHRALGVFPMSQRAQDIGAHAVNRYNLFVHGSLLFELLAGTVNSSGESMDSQLPKVATWVN